MEDGSGTFVGPTFQHKETHVVHFWDVFIPGSAQHAPGRKFQTWDMTIGTSLHIGIVGELERSD